MHIKATIITIGDELLIGQVIDTNSAWIAKEIAKAGIKIQKRVSVGDTWNDIWRTLDEESKNAEIILITGGLGPTADDITKPLLCEYFGGKLVTDERALENIINIFTNHLKKPLIERNLKQAEVPNVCTVIPNSCGTAPGMWFEKDNTVYVSMPGVPFEMQAMMQHTVIPKIHEKYSLPPIIYKTLLVYGIGESFLAERLINFEKNLPEYIKLAYLPNFGLLRLRLTMQPEHLPDGVHIQTEMEQQFLLLQTEVQEYFVIDKDLTMQEVVGNMLQENGKTLSTAESCTGGYIAHLISSVPGASAYYLGSIVAYDNSVKENQLHVKNETLEKFGAVSKETVEEMVAGALESMQTDYALAVSGILGPDGGTTEKPVGLVWIAVGNKAHIVAKKFNFRFDRHRNMQITAMNALNLLRLFIKENNS